MENIWEASFYQISQGTMLLWSLNAPCVGIRKSILLCSIASGRDIGDSSFYTGNCLHFSIQEVFCVLTLSIVAIELRRSSNFHLSEISVVADDDLSCESSQYFCRDLKRLVTCLSVDAKRMIVAQTTMGKSAAID